VDKKQVEENKAKANSAGKIVVKSSIIETPVEKIIQSIGKSKKVNFKEISEKFGMKIESVENIALALEKHGIVDVHYPELMTSSPWISLQTELPQLEAKEATGEIVEEYSYVVDFVPVKIKIIKQKGEERPLYFLDAPKINSYTSAFMDEIKEQIVDKIPFEGTDITDKDQSQKLKTAFFDVSKKELEKYFGSLDTESTNMLAGIMLHSMYGLGKLELMMEDNFLEEITINSSKTPVVVYHRKHGWLKTNMKLESEDAIYNYASQIARKVGRDITTLSPILDAHLLSGDRVNATLHPISSFGNTLTIRRFARRPWTIIDFIGKSHTMNVEMASVLWLAMQYEMNIIIAGGTASGKTSTLNALSAFMPNYHRIISIEDVRELFLPKYLHDNWVPLTTRNPNQESKGEVTMLDLMQSSLRMRPDRIIVGEIRRHTEAEVLFEAMHTGHSVYSTLHANSSNQALRRLIEEPISIPPLEVEAIDLILVQHRDRKHNVRRTFEIAEIDTGVGDQQLNSNTIFKWLPREDEWETTNPASKFVRNLNLNTGMTETEITKELEERARILNWMSETNQNDIDQVGNLMNLFYSQPDLVVKAAKKKLDPKELFKVD